MALEGKGKNRRRPRTFSSLGWYATAGGGLRGLFRDVLELTCIDEEPCLKSLGSYWLQYAYEFL